MQGLQGGNQQTVDPAPGLPTCSADEGCDEWSKVRWRRERSVAGDGFPLAVDEQVRVRLSTVRSGQLFVGLCSEASGVGCAVIAAVGTSNSTGLRFETRVTPTEDIADPTARVVSRAPGGGTAALPSGRRYTLVVHRRSEVELTAWLDGRPSDKAAITLQPGMIFLRARSAAGNVSFAQGQEADGYHMQVGERVIVRLTVTRDGLLDVGLCGDRSCSVVRISGAEDNTMGWSSRITTTNSVVDERGQTLQPASGPGSFPLGKTFSFVVLRRTEWALDVWLESDAEHKATVPLEPDRLRLKVDSDAGQTALVRGEAPDGFTLQPGKRVRLEVAAEAADGAVVVALCGATSCGVVRVVGARPGAGLGFSTRVTDTNNPSGDGEDIAQAQGPTGFPRGRRVRLVARHVVDGGATSQLQVWLDEGGGEDKLAVVNVPSDQASAARLKIASSVGTVKLVQVLSEGHELAVGEMVTVALTVTREDGWMFLGLCGQASCSAVGVIGATDDNRFSFTSRITSSNSVVGEGAAWQSQTRGPRRFIKGQTLRFVVHRRTETLMDVWLEPAPSRKATIPLEPDRSILKVATDAGHVEYLTDDAAGRLGDRGYRLAVAEDVRVEVHPSSAQGWVFLGLCGPVTCSVLGVGGAGKGHLSTATKTSNGNSVLALGPALDETPGPDTFEVNSTVALLVRRSTELLLTVRPDMDGASEVTLPLEPQQDALDVVSAVGTTTLLPGSTVDGYPMAVDERILLRFRPTRPDGWLALGLCDMRACSAVRVTAGAPLSYSARVTSSNSVGDLRGDAIGQAEGAPLFDVGRNYTFVVHRHSDRALDVWLEGDSGAKVTVPLEPGRSIFKADGNAGHTYLEARGAVDGWPMAVGDTLWLSLSVAYPDGRLYLGLCGEDSCSVVRVRGADGSSMGFSTAVLATNSVSGRGSDLQQLEGPEGFTPGQQHVFVVRRASADTLEVWLEDDPENRASVPTTADKDRLKVASTAGTTTFVKGRDWVSDDRAAMLASPSLPPPAVRGAKLCVELEYMAPSRDHTITLGAVEEQGGGTSALAELATDRAGSWRRRTVLAQLPETLASSSSPWRLTVSSAPGSRIRSVSQCALDKYKRVVVAGTSRRRRRQNSWDRWTIGSSLKSGDRWNSDSSWNSARRLQRQTAGGCANGGQRNTTTDECNCPAGFAGATCEAGCQAGSFGVRCELRCPQGGCDGVVLCVSGLYCACAPGFRGDRCDQVCATGDPDCSFPCADRQRG